jgi:hypothetical protein
MRNRYGDEYTFDRVDENTYTIKGDLKYWCFGGREGQERLDITDLGFVDPSGGPFIEIGAKIEGREIVSISADGDLDGSPRILFGVK